MGGLELNFWQGVYCLILLSMTFELVKFVVKETTKIKLATLELKKEELSWLKEGLLEDKQ